MIGKKTISIDKGQKSLIGDSMVIAIDETDKSSTEIKFLIPKLTLEFSIAEVGMSFCCILKMVYISMEIDLYMKMYENNGSKEVINSDGAKVLAISWCFYTCFYLYVCYL